MAMNIRSFRSKILGSMLQHLRSKLRFNCTSSPENVKCKQCNLVMHFVSDLRRHTCRQRNLQTATPRTPFRCKKCMFGSYSKLVFGIHQCVINTTIYYCDQCSYCSQYESHLEQHKGYKHTSKERKWFQCDHCSFMSKRENALRIHTAAAHRILAEYEGFNCEHCSYRVKQKHRLKAHILSKHTAPENVRWIQCEHCEYRCTYKSYLKSHVLKKHKKLNDDAWINCGYYKQKSNLRNHVLSKHRALTDVPWFQCEHCEYRGKQKSHLKIHMGMKHFKRTV